MLSAFGKCVVNGRTEWNLSIFQREKDRGKNNFNISPVLFTLTNDSR